MIRVSDKNFFRLRRYNPIPRVLEVGCGSRPTGLVNLDIALGASVDHRHFYEPKKIINFIQGDGQQLPFKNKSFDKVVCYQTLEHMRKPYLALEEFKRISPLAVISVPNNPRIEEHDKHLYSWSKQSFESFLKEIYPYVEVHYYATINDLTKSRLFHLMDNFKSIKHRWRLSLRRFYAFELVGVCFDSSSDP